MGHVRSVVASAAALSVAAVVMLPSPGTAAPSSHTTKAAAARAAVAKMHLHTAHATPGTRAALFHSPTWSGYADVQATTGTISYKSVSASWSQPSVTCTKEDRIAVFWVGIDGVTDNTVEQAGTFAQCFQGTAFYYTWWEMYPTNSIQVVGTTVTPGDQILASVSLSAGTYTLAVTDSTKPANSFSTQQTCGTGQTCANSSAEVIAERPSSSLGVYPLAQFSTWSPGNIAVSSTTKSGTISTFPMDEIQMYDGTNTYYLAKVSSFSATTKSFTDKWMNSY